MKCEGFISKLGCLKGVIERNGERDLEKIQVQSRIDFQFVFMYDWRVSFV